MQRVRLFSRLVIDGANQNPSVPEQIGLSAPPLNPALPPRKVPTIPSRFRPPPGPVATTTRGDGPRRVYLDVQSTPPNLAYPPRPVPGSVADLDIIMDHCDFSQGKVRFVLILSSAH
jgi:WD repeat and SOF domain-containing protein 1